jgi:hypothetical protein
MARDSIEIELIWVSGLHIETGSSRFDSRSGSAGSGTGLETGLRWNTEGFVAGIAVSVVGFVG